MGDCFVFGDDYFEDDGEELDVSDMFVDFDVMEFVVEVVRFDKQQEEFVVCQRVDVVGVFYYFFVKLVVVVGEKKIKGGVIIVKGCKCKLKIVKGLRQVVKFLLDILF